MHLAGIDIDNKEQRNLDLFQVLLRTLRLVSKN